MANDIPYAAVNAEGDTTSPSFLKSPVDFFKGRKPLWWIWWIVRVAAPLHSHHCVHRAVE